MRRESRGRRRERWPYGAVGVVGGRVEAGVAPGNKMRQARRSASDPADSGALPKMCRLRGPKLSRTPPTLQGMAHPIREFLPDRFYLLTNNATDACDDDAKLPTHSETASGVDGPTRKTISMASGPTSILFTSRRMISRFVRQSA